MTVDASIVPGLLFLLVEVAALTAVGYVIVRVALCEEDDRVALAQGLVVGPAIWGVVVNIVMYALPGMVGAVAGWIFVLALAAVLIWRAPRPIRPRLQIAAGFSLAALAVFWIALASRQTVGIPDVAVHLGLHASIRAGGFPPELSWSPGTPAPYHYGIDLLAGLLAPPSGPNLAFVQELLGAYAWTSLFLVVIATLLRRASGLAVLVAAPLLLTAGAWTFDGSPARIVELVLPAGIPAAGLRASLAQIYWPSVNLPWASINEALPDIYKPALTLSYAAAFVVLSHATRPRRRSWPFVIALAALFGFLSLTSSTLTPIVFVLWAGLEAVWLMRSKRAGSLKRRDLIRPASGLALAGLLFFLSGSLTSMLNDSLISGLAIGRNEYLGGWRLLGTLEQFPGGVGILSLGPLAVAGAAVLLARGDNLVRALAAGTCLLLLAAVPLVYEPVPGDVGRIEGHARNFALYAFLLALGIRLAGLRSRHWRYAAAAAVAAVVTWPTVAQPVRNVGVALGDGIELSNARPPLREQEAESHIKSRYALESLPSDRIAAYVRNNTPVEARVFSPHPSEMTYATGRPNASGFAGHVHLEYTHGPEFWDVLNYLEPRAIARLGYEYVHAPDSWVESLPGEAVAWLNDPNLFELLVRDESESLYRVLPALLGMDAAPASYEALRQAVPASATVYMPGGFATRSGVRAASALSHTQLYGDISLANLHLRTSWTVEPLAEHVPGLIIMSPHFVPWMLPPAARQPIWWNEENAVFAVDGTIGPIMPPPSVAPPLPFSVRISDARGGGQMAFTATFDDRAPERWTGQDWIVIALDDSPWGIPTHFLPDGYTPASAAWFPGQVGPGWGETTRRYEFDFRAGRLAVRDDDGELTSVESSEWIGGSGSYVLALRLRERLQPRLWQEVAVIPVLKITVSETGEVSYHVHEQVGG
ncbi:MAG: hypothetical protein OXG46_02770 [Chloroflexi bacterium]|nr:hypothetical protein [Chloroflexota bacterium]MCY3938959.1 hypothetical protein [Chloroflexota bacterium]